QDHNAAKLACPPNEKERQTAITLTDNHIVDLKLLLLRISNTPVDPESSELPQLQAYHIKPGMSIDFEFSEQ
ncbi:unnamed protein product, partial [Amoebophrya sp. A120]